MVKTGLVLTSCYKPQLLIISLVNTKGLLCSKEKMIAVIFLVWKEETSNSSREFLMCDE